MPRLFIFGDSTAAIKSDDARPETGWGECFAPYLSPHWILDNRAVNGRSTRQVLQNGEFFRALSIAAASDAALIQYGHNESKPDAERHTEPWTDFVDNLSLMADSLHSKGVAVFFLTPISRRRFSDGILLDTHGDYPLAMKEAGRRLSVPVLDVTDATMKLLSELGEEKSRELFMNFDSGLYPNYPDGDDDNTHLRPYGAKTIAKIIADLLAEYKPHFLKKM